MTPGQRLKLAGWVLVFYAGGFLLAGVAVLPLGSVLIDPDISFLRLAAIQTVGLLVGFGLMTWLVGSRVLGCSRADLEQLPPGAAGRRRWHRLGWGLLLGAGLAAVAMLLAVPAGNARWGPDRGGVLDWLGAVGVMAAVLLPAALAEELAFRGAPLLALSRALGGKAPAIVTLAVLFAAAHWANPSVTPVALANIGLAGVMLALVFYTPGGLWTSTGAHLGWNLTLGGLGAPVSGLPLPLPALDYSPGGPGWLTGGSFGPEGGVLASLCLAAGALLAGRKLAGRGGIG